MNEKPWLNEPDRLEFESHGFPCMVIRHNHRPEHNPKDWLGHLCGYVGVPKDHPLYNKSARWGEREENSPIDNLEVHGGITFSDFRDEKKDFYYFGFDAAHCDDLIPGFYELRQPGECLYEIYQKHKAFSDLFKETYKDMNYMKAECENLAKQLRELA